MKKMYKNMKKETQTRKNIITQNSKAQKRRKIKIELYSRDKRRPHNADKISEDELREREREMKRGVTMSDKEGERKIEKGREREMDIDRQIDR